MICIMLYFKEIKPDGVLNKNKSWERISDTVVHG